ncbi:GDSL-type esterase/lipase family protein [Engelhardtia mirabilis]|uniref:Trehalose utilization n=1 Tax=Engelhardtia mirabilis TaxID=2528011 RepID=A0A518BHH5_9BACT|nr:Trehalose utilization [Planctomycetes bacterium Pla133]QDV00730.1 Trehalose utilization [Planctomycetes bacterium Pla86]
MRLPTVPLVFLAACGGSAPSPTPESEAGSAPEQHSVPPHVVFVTGDEEYRSEESMPMLASILEREFGFRTTVCYALSEEGEIDPNRLDHIDGLEALEDADLMVLFTRFRQLPDEELDRILAFVDSGKPLVGLRTSTHAFRYPDDHPRAAAMNEIWPQRVFGQKWITHHGHFDDGDEPLTDVTIAPGAEQRSILRGVEPFQAFSWLYHVQGGGDTLPISAEPLLFGEALRSSHEAEFERFPKVNPVAWTKSHRFPGGYARVFFTTLGHPYDFRDENMRRLAVQGMLWALEREDLIGEDGVPVEAPDYDPSNSGFGQVYRKGLFPHAPRRGSSASFELAQGDVIALVGGGFADRTRFDGQIEARLQAGLAEMNVGLRNLGWEGDEVTRFADLEYPGLGGGSIVRGWSGDDFEPQTRPFGVPTREDWLTEVGADTILACFGMSESFAGEAGLADFEADLHHFLDELDRRSFNGGESKPQVVLVSPVAHESLGFPMPDGSAHDGDVARYTEVMARVARERDLLFVDLYAPTRAAIDAGEGPLTSDGIHPDAAGYRLCAEVIAQALGVAEAEGADLDELATLARAKDHLWFARFRTGNSEYVHGRRVKPFGVDDFPPRFAALAERLVAADEDIWNAVGGVR